MLAMPEIDELEDVPMLRGDEADGDDDFTGEPGSEEDLERFFKKVKCKRCQLQLVAVTTLSMKPFPRHLMSRSLALRRHTR